MDIQYLLTSAGGIPANYYRTTIVYTIAGL